MLNFACWQPRGKTDSCPKAASPPPTPWQSGGKSFHRQREGATHRNSMVSSDSHPEIGHRGLTTLVVVGSYPPSVGLFVSWGQFSKLWQLTSRLQSGHRVAVISPLVGVSASIRCYRLEGMAQTNTCGPGEGTKGPWLCLTSTLGFILFGLLWLFSFVSAIPHFSD